MEDDPHQYRHSPRRNPDQSSDNFAAPQYAAGKVHLFVLNYSEYLGKIDTVDDMAISVVVPKNLLDQGLIAGLEVSLVAGPAPLDVQRGNHDSSREADYSYSTNLGGTVPPRLPRRPRSEISQAYLSDLAYELDRFQGSQGAPPASSTPPSVAGQTRTKGHRRTNTDDMDRGPPPPSHRRTMTEDLDKVMATARAEVESDTPSPRRGKALRLPQRPANVVKTHPQVVSSSTHPQSVNLGRLATDTEATLEHRRQTKHRSVPLTGSLPPRPLAEQVERARDELQRFSKTDSFGIEEITDFSLSNRDEDDNALIDTGGNKDEFVAPPIIPSETSERIQQVLSQTRVKPVTSRTPVPQLRAPQPPVNTAAADADDDDEYYDIGEPVFIHNPKPQRKSTRGKKSKKKNELKPFSYTTLVNLLESVNGTIIGEEFAKLNLPVREKQLIEKIIDLLLRLTLDMVIDEQRYDVGIKRLEKALRALEGFM